MFVCADSLGGLQELLQTHPALLPLHTAAIIEKIAPRMADGDRSVREALLSLLSKTVLPAMPQVRGGFFACMWASFLKSFTGVAIEHYALLLLGTETVRSQVCGLDTCPAFLWARAGKQSFLAIQKQ